MMCKKVIGEVLDLLQGFLEVVSLLENVIRETTCEHKDRDWLGRVQRKGKGKGQAGAEPASLRK